MKRGKKFLVHESGVNTQAKTLFALSLVIFYAVEDRATIKVLEVGCGPGANIWYLAREGFSVYAVEGSASAIEKAHNRLAAEVPHWQGELKSRGFFTFTF